MTTTTELRSLIVDLSRLAGAELALLWAQFANPQDVEEGLMAVLPTLVDNYGDAAAVAAADWYDEYREQLAISGSYRADLAVVDLGAQALAGWGASLVTQEVVDWDAALVRITGGLEKRIATAGRETITNNTFDDPQSVGWQRKARPGACGFCQMLAGRGSVYKSRTTADFGAHDACQCLAVPAFGGRPVPVKPYKPSSRNITAADRSSAQTWIKENLE